MRHEYTNLPVWQLTSDTSREGLAVLSVASSPPGAETLASTAVLAGVGRDQLLTEGVADLVEYLSAAVAAGAPSVAVDVRPAGNDVGWAAYVEAARGLVQSLVLELPTGSAAINVVISAPEQDLERAATFAYLSSTDGTFCVGATIDLRSAK